MSVMRVRTPDPPGGPAVPPQPRVREMARAAVAVGLISASLSVGIVLLFLLAHGLGR